MNTDRRDLGYLEDQEILNIARTQETYCEHTLVTYANMLQQHAIRACALGNLDDALELAEREFTLCWRGLGLRHAYSQRSMRRYIDLQADQLEMRVAA